MAPTSREHYWYDNTSYGRSPKEQRGVKPPSAWVAYYSGFRLVVYWEKDVLCWRAVTYGDVSVELSLRAITPEEARREAVTTLERRLKSFHEQVLNHEVMGP